MLFRFRKKLATQRFDKEIAAIQSTPPLVLRDGPLTFVSMVSKYDFFPYLLAIKSLYTRIGYGRIVAIIDRDTPQMFIDAVTSHIPGVEFKILEDIHPGTCQRGGTWERIYHVLDLSEQGYVIQADADTLTCGDLPEVLACIEANRSFTLNGAGNKRTTMAEAAREAQGMQTDYMGIISERAFAKYPDADSLYYIRGSSGFCGYAKGAFAKERIEQFHTIMMGLVPDVWRKWGSEQCASNFAVANSPDPVILPFPDYSNFYPGSPRESRVYHFIGSYRYDDGHYAKCGQREIERLMTL
jgi:hypothetical protein